MRKLILFIITAATFSAIAQEQQSERRGPPPDFEKMRAAMDACATEKGLQKPQPGQRPSEADRQAMDECLASKGISRPAHGHRPPPPSDQGQNQQGGAELGTASVR